MNEMDYIGSKEKINAMAKDAMDHIGNNFSSKSLLRYPGGKTRAIDEITRYFPNEMKEMSSPFFGGGSIEICMASKGVKVHGYDAFTPLVEFWQCVLRTPYKLAIVVEEYLPLTKKNFYDLKQSQSTFKTKLERAAAFYVLNRSSFSGSTLSGGMSPKHPRFTPSSIDRLRAFHNPNIKITKMDFENSINNSTNMFKYLDPPYFLINQTLYGKNGSTHRDFDHDRLYDVLLHQNNWIMSYNDCDAVRTMYRDYRMETPVWKYGMSKNKSSNELLIFSKDIT